MSVALLCVNFSGARFSFSGRVQQREQSGEQLDRPGWAAADVQVDRDDVADGAHHGIASREDPAVSGAIPDRDHPLGIGRRIICALQRLSHVLGDRPGHQQHVGMPRRGDEAQPEPLQIVERVVERVNLQLAAVA